jgi:Gpi18-like mannosyltransferase
MALLCLLAARRQKWIEAGVFGGLSALTRYAGILLAAPILWEAWECYRFRLDVWKVNFVCLILGLMILPISFLLSAVYEKYFAGQPWLWISKPKLFDMKLIWPGTGILGNAKMILQLGTPISFFI